MPASNYTRGCFEQDYDIFYFLTYTNNSDFSCGYFASGDGIDKLSISQYSSSIITASDSPLEFVDQVEIKEIKFIYSYKYAYYTIYNPITDKTYHGIIDTKTNSIVFNTEEEILTFVPYNVISMVAITSTGAYQICVIKQDNACIDSYGCTTQNFNYILYTEGNKCQDSCENGKILLIRENFCGDSCDESIYMLVNNQCGLCKYFHSVTPYKLINTSQCLSENDIPVGAEIYNSKLYLLKCKSGYILKDGTCITHCY